MALETMIVNGDRYLLNTSSAAVDQTADTILSHYPSDAIVEFDTPNINDFKNNRYE